MLNIVIKNKLIGWILWRMKYANRHHDTVQYWYRLRKGQEDINGIYKKKEKHVCEHCGSRYYNRPE